MHRRATFLLLPLLLAVVGCEEQIQTRYGQRAGPEATLSVNGTAVLAEMFEQAGHKVSSWNMLSPRLAQRAECIVWFPDDFRPPSREVIAWLEHWLWERPDRTLIYVGRDFDAARLYWATIEPDAPAEQAAEVKRRLDAARDDFQRGRRWAAGADDTGWFALDRDYRPREVRSLAGDERWLDGVDASQLEIELFGRMKPNAWADVLLESEGDALVARESFGVRGGYGESRLFIVANGSFLLNLPLVNREHRKLAGKLVAEIGTLPRKVVFLESGRNGPPIHEEEPDNKQRSGIDVLLTEPFSWIFLQLAVVGVLFCFARWPIFGRPRPPEKPEASDFGKHIQAFADMLERSRDRGYAQTRLLHYQQIKMKDETRRMKDEG
jgi:hypothetical protein